MLGTLAIVVAQASACTTASPRSGSTDATAVSTEPSAQERIRYYSARIAESPRLYPMYTQLGIALFDRARETHDPALLAQARENEQKALSMQDNFEALMAMTAIQNYSHRFEDAMAWGKRAAAASVGGSASRDPAVTAALVEALLGLGKRADAAVLLPASIDDARDFHTAVSLGRVHAESGRPQEALAAFSRASELARKEHVPALAAWAETACAGTLIDNGHAAEAAPYLETAAKLAPATTFLRLHRAEAADALGKHAEAAAILGETLAQDADPAIEAFAAVVTRRAGDNGKAEEYFAAAERGFRRAVEAGEVYTLGALAQLYLDADRHPDETLRLARENFRWKRDRAAVNTLAAAETARPH